ncbi:hypothetical protein CJ030_MR2G019468 [Morella rubra]|uniref:GRF-type domain-containing protein n=1 Tax=Morella rubra TaxID=262757 RepID=A0A6A1WCE9_9ROSI|nr:hypothetical protein CJ030_MR2G019468 [Morella rubra]
MTSASSSSVSNGRQEWVSLEAKVDEATRLCFCGMKARMRTSRTEGNPGRRFFGCPRYSSGQTLGIDWKDIVIATWNSASVQPLASLCVIAPNWQDALAGMVRKVKILEDKVKMSEDKVKTNADKVNFLEEQVQVQKDQLIKHKAKERQLKAVLLGSWMFFACVFLLLCS